VGLQRYSLTICCHDRRHAFDDAAARDVVLSCLRHISETHRFAVFVYCLMPDHVHFVVQGRADDSDCLVFVRIFKQKTAFAWKQRIGERLWQNSFHDRVLRDSEATQRVVRYVLENPVRANLVTSAEMYPHSGSLVYNRAELIAWAFGWNGANGVKRRGV
jgi:REP element-mobilizing transposase RayT